MKRILLSLLALFTLFTTASAQQSLNMTLLSNWDDPSLPSGWTGQYNDIWGYVDNQGREYAIMGVMLGTYFFDVTDPTNPVVVDYVASKDQFTLAVHRDYKTYQHYCYAVADEGQNSLQIIDLQYLPDSVHVVYDSDAFCRKAHNIFISGEKLFLASNTVGGSFNAMDVLSLANPENPTFLSTLFNPQFFHVHDVYVLNDTAYCSNGNEGFYVYDYTDPVNPSLVSSINLYPQQGYNHSSWVSEDRSTLVFADENHGKALKLYDITDIQNPTLLGLFQSNLLNVPNPSGQDGSIPHNPFFMGNKLVITSYYHDGVQVYHLPNPNQPVQIAYYDTYPQSVNYNGYEGCWGVYPYLPSGIILASDISNGLFVLELNLPTGIDDPVSAQQIFTYPNPFSNDINISIPELANENMTVEVFDMTGKLVYREEGYFTGQTLTVNMSGLSTGVYSLRVNTGNGIYNNKLVRN